MPPKAIPERWLPYIPIGSPVRGTRFIALKVPLKEHVCAKLQPKYRWTVDILCSSYPDIGMIVDLTMTKRYYDSTEVLNKGVDYCKIPLPGQKIPPESLVKKFFAAVDFYLEHRHDESLIGVHCTHGVNRTGYMIARYLIQRMGYSVSDALESITVARGHPIEREYYISHLGRSTDEVPKMLNGQDIQPGRSSGEPTRASQAEKGKPGGKRPASNAFADKGKGTVKRHGPARGNFRDNDSSWNPSERNLNPWESGHGPNVSNFGRPDPGFRRPKRSEFVDDSELDRRSPGDWTEWKEKDRPHLPVPVHHAGPRFDEPTRFVPDVRRDFREEAPPGRHFPPHERFDPRRPPSFQSGPPIQERGGEDDRFAGGRPMEGRHFEGRSFEPRGDHGRMEHRGHPDEYVDERWEERPGPQGSVNEIFHGPPHQSPGRNAPYHPGHFQAPDHRMQPHFGHPDHRMSPPRNRPMSPPRRHISPPRGRPMSPPRGRPRSPLRNRPMTPPRGHPMSPPRRPLSPPRGRPMSPRGRPMSPMRSHLISPPRGRPMTPPDHRIGRRISPPRGPRMSPPRGPRMSPPRGPRMSPPRGPRMSPPRGPRMSPSHGPRMSPPRGTRMSPPRGPRMSPPRHRISPRRQSPSHRRFSSGHRVSPPRAPRMSPPPMQRPVSPVKSGLRMSSVHRISPGRGPPERRSPPPRPPRVSPPRGLRRMTPPPARRNSPRPRRISPPRGHKMAHPLEAEPPPRPKGRRMSPPRHRMASPVHRASSPQPIGQISPPPPRNIPPTNPRARSPVRRRPSAIMDGVPESREDDLCGRMDHLDERYGPEIEPFPLERSPPRQEVDRRQSMGRMRRSRSPIKRQGSPHRGIASPKRRRPFPRKDVLPKGRGNVPPYHEEPESRSDRRMPTHDGVRGYGGPQQRTRPAHPRDDIDFDNQEDGNWRERKGYDQSHSTDRDFIDEEEPLDEPERFEQFSMLEEGRRLQSPRRQFSPRRTNDYPIERQRRPTRGKGMPRAGCSSRGSRQPLDRNRHGSEFGEEAMGGAMDDQEYEQPFVDDSRGYARGDRYIDKRQNFRSPQDSPQAGAVQYEDYRAYSHRSRSPPPNIDDIEHNPGWDEEEPMQDCRELLLQKRVTRSIGALSPTALNLIGPDDEVIVIEESSTENSRPSSRARRPVAVKLRKSPSSARPTKPVFDRLDDKKPPVFDRLEEPDRRPSSGSRAGSHPAKPRATNSRTDSRVGSRSGVVQLGDTRGGNKPGEKHSGNKPRGSPSRGNRLPSNDARRPPKTDQPARPSRVSRPPPKTSPVKARLGQRGRR